MTTANDIADKIASEHNLTKSQAKAIVDEVFNAISNAAASGTETSIPGFGKFKVKEARNVMAVTRRRERPSRSLPPRD